MYGCSLPITPLDDYMINHYSAHFAKSFDILFYCISIRFMYVFCSPSVSLRTVSVSGDSGIACIMDTPSVKFVQRSLIFYAAVSHHRLLHPQPLRCFQ